MKAITTRSGVAYEGPSIPTNPSPKKEKATKTNESYINLSSVLTNKEKLFELAKIPLNENCSAMLLKKLPEKLGDPDKFLIPCDFPGMDFHFPTNFVVVDFEADPRVPLILGRSFLRTGRALIDVYGEEITLRVNDEAVTFNLDQTTRYSSTYDDMSVNRIDVTDVASEEYAQEVLGFSNNYSGGNPTTTFEPIISDSFLSFTPFEENDFILEEIEAFLKDDSISLEIDHAVYFCCSKKGLEDKILVPKPPRNCARCGTPVDGPYCQGCALLRKKFKEDLFTYCVENEFFKDFQDTSESSDDNTNVVNAPREP
ncbi:reverse transcriptase domain-containing protein [Tanacetum coccineum]